MKHSELDSTDVSTSAERFAGQNVRGSTLSYAEYRRSRFFPSLDGIRCFCILAVLWHHSMAQVLPWQFFDRGFLGVDMFFILSGYLIVTLLLREKDRYGSISLSAFYARRTLRIFPIYYLLVFGTGVVTLFLSEDSATRRATNEIFGYAVTYTMNFAPASESVYSHLWSLSIEEQFYLLWPLAEKRLARTAMAPLLLLLFGLVVLADTGAFHGHETDGLPWRLLIRGPFANAIVWGVLLAHLLHDPAWYERIRRMLRWRWSSVLILVLLLSVLAIPGQRHPWPALATHVLMTLFLAACLVRPRNPLAPILNFKPIAYVGVVSYGIYLYHMHVRHFCVALMHSFGAASPWLTFVLMTAASIGVASLSYHFLELPILAHRSRFVRTEAGRPAANAK